MRGQAHVAFQDVPQATAALRALQGFTINGKNLASQLLVLSFSMFFILFGIIVILFGIIDHSYCVVICYA
jgi:hypothetical protein